jgi:hypothetical protein
VVGAVVSCFVNTHRLGDSLPFHVTFTKRAPVAKSMVSIPPQLRARWFGVQLANSAIADIDIISFFMLFIFSVI